MTILNIETLSAVGSAPRRIRIDRELATAVCRHSEQGFPHEVCGALGGVVRGDTWCIETVQAGCNRWVELGIESDSGVGTERRFALAPDWILATEKAFRAQGQELLGFYHSHPESAAVPSETDRRYLWPRVVQVICSVREGRADDVAAWFQREDQGPFERIDVERIDSGE